MTSVPNHRLRLNGSKYIVIFLVIFGLLSCAAPRKTITKPPSTPPTVEKEDKVRVYDPKTDSYILVPRDAVKVDTVKWTEDPSPPLIKDGPIKPDKPVHKDHYDIALLMPFNVPQAPFFSEQQDAKLNRFIHYYAGIQMAMEEISSKGLPVTIHSYDVEGSSGSISSLLRRPELSNADVIVGPYEKEHIEMTAAFGLKNEVMVVSPWLPAFSSPTENPFLMQLFPGLQTYADAILEFIKEEMPGKKVFIVGRDNPGELSRIQMFNKNPEVKTHEFIVHDLSPDLTKTDLKSLMSEHAGTIFILPYFAKADENFVNSFMRKLHADKETKEAIVFGLPQWVGYTNLNPYYMESLSLHLGISSFIDVSHPNYASFRSSFYAKFHTVPDLQAFQGYDLMLWLAGRLTQNGQEGLIGYMDRKGYGLASGFDIRPVFGNDMTNNAEMKVPLYYENRRIRFIKYFEQDFVLVK